MDALSLYKVGRWCLRHRIPVIPKLMQGVGQVVFSAVVPPGAEIGEGTRLGYRGLGIVIHARARIGSNVLIGPGVTIGGRSGYDRLPVIGDRVMIGTGAKILGPVNVGDGAVIGANAVVVRDVPARAIAAGVPARVIKQNVDVDEYASMPKPAGSSLA